ncbi:MAG: MoaD/ThiS family protein [Candidatus Odinarchaeota archaeon]|nr:MoaD/ThiS family protein [Candidatus Odinarchaeota archaeon]
MVRIKALGVMRDLLGFKEKEIIIDKPRPLREIIDVEKLSALEPERIIILVNHQYANFDTAIKNEDYVAILPVIGGG